MVAILSNPDAYMYYFDADAAGNAADDADLG